MCLCLSDVASRKEREKSKGEREGRKEGGREGGRERGKERPPTVFSTFVSLLLSD